MRSTSLSALALALALASSGAAEADPELRESVVAHALDVKLKIPSSVVYDPARLGHVVMPARVTVTNRGATAIPLDPKGVRMTARGPRGPHPCDARAPTDRWPTELAPGESFTSERAPICETTMPGRHDLEVRWAGQSDADPPIATSTFGIEPGALPPVPLATRPELVATATGSRDVRPSNEPGKVRIIIGLVNAGTTVTSLSPLVVDTTLRRAGKPLACRDRRTVELSGMLAPGQQHVVWLPLACAVPYEGDWEATVEVGEPNARRVRLQRHVVHVEAVPDAMQPPQALPRRTY